MGSIYQDNNTLHINSPTQKYTTTISQIPIVFTSTSPSFRLDELNNFVLEIASTNKNIQEALEQVNSTSSTSINGHPELLNSSFIELMHTLFSLIRQYDSLSKLDLIPPQHNQNKQPTQNETYVFKIPKKETVFEKHWKEHFKELEEFKKQFGHCNVSRTTKGFDQLGNWLSDQRRKLRRGKLTQQQYQMLTDLGWMFILLE